MGIAVIAKGLVGLAVLYLGGEALVHGAPALALRLGVPPLAIGLTIVAFGTSAPELVVSLNAVLVGANDIAVGNVVGSNICNIALILGVSALIRPLAVHAKVVRMDVPLMIAASLVLMAMLANGRISRLEGGLLLGSLATYTVSTFWQARRESAAVRSEIVSAVSGAHMQTTPAVLLVAGGLLALPAGGHLLLESAIDLASGLGVSEAVIGLTLVAFGTSLPEFATSVIASVRGQGDLAIGNVVGSNLFNILGIVGVTSLVSPLARGGVGWVDLVAMLVVTGPLVPLLHPRLRIGRAEGALLTVCYLGYVGWTFTS